MPTGKHITELLELEIVRYYKMHPMTIGDVAEHFGLCDPTIIKILNKYSIKRYSKTQIYNPYINESYFEIIDSEIKAYFVGFLITDGNVFINNKGEAHISISQHSKDRYILERFKDEIGLNKNITHDGRGCSQICVCSNKMADDLSQYGIIPNKTLITELPHINKKLMPHLIRGILDGDGNIKAYQTSVHNRYAHAISFCGTHKLMEDISNYLHQSLNVRNSIVYDYSDRHLSEVKWQNISDMYAIGEWIYKDANIYLNRKYNLYLDFVNHYNLKHGNTEITVAI